MGVFHLTSEWRILINHYLNSHAPLQEWLASQEQELTACLPDVPNRGSRISDTAVSAVLVRNTVFTPHVTEEIECGSVVQFVESRARPLISSIFYSTGRPERVLWEKQKIMQDHAVWHGVVFVPLYDLRMTSTSAVSGHVSLGWKIAYSAHDRDQKQVFQVDLASRRILDLTVDDVLDLAKGSIVQSALRVCRYLGPLWTHTHRSQKRMTTLPLNDQTSSSAFSSSTLWWLGGRTSVRGTRGRWSTLARVTIRFVPALTLPTSDLGLTEPPETGLGRPR